MILAIDIGNTNIKVGIFKKNKLALTYNFPPQDNIEKNFKPIKKYQFDYSVISSVVPDLTNVYKKIIKKYFKIGSLIINNKNCKINLKVKSPETVGADRICNIVATVEFYSIPAVVIDFGTATTYDVINNNKEFIGGAIAPGIETSAKNLIDNAALLSTADLIFPKNVIGKNTTANIQAGIMYGAVEQVEGMINRINKETGVTNNIILTGGFSKLISPQLSLKHSLDIDLTLKGMVFINEINKL